MTKGKVPEKFSFSEKLLGFMYGVITYAAVILLISSLVFFIWNYVSYILDWDIRNPDFIQLCIYLIIGTFTLLFVYDEKCRKRVFNK